MAVDTLGIDYTTDGLSKVIPAYYAQEALSTLNERLCLSEITNANVIGADKIKQAGDRINIPLMVNPPVFAYQKNMALRMDNLSIPNREMTVDHAFAFNFGFDMIDLQQMAIKDWMKMLAEQTTFTAKKRMETAVFANVYADVAAQNAGATAGIDGDINLGVTGTPIVWTSTNAIDKILEAGQVLDEQNVPNENCWMVIPPAMATKLKSSDLKNASFTGEDLSLLKKKGVIGSIDRFNIIVSNLLTKDTSTNDYHILFGHKDAIWFVNTMTKVVSYEPDTSFASALKGLYVYGYGVLRPEAIGEIVAHVA